MSPETSRRSVIIGAAVIPALTVPAVAQIDRPDARLIALGERLKVLIPHAAELKLKATPLRKEAIAGLPEGWGLNDELSRIFQERATENGYHQAYDEWSDACSELFDVARAILEIPSTDAVGDGIRAAAALAFDHDCENASNMKNLLWDLAARAGFTPPTKPPFEDEESEEDEQNEEEA
jgi:hypothetical protein